MHYIRVQTDDFDAGAEMAFLRRQRRDTGALVAFVGQVRDWVAEGESTTASSAQEHYSLMLEHYPGMTEKSLQAIAQQAETRWPVHDVLIIHRVGLLAPLDQIVLVAVTGRHRGDAFLACEFVMDYLKTQAPFWKKETTPNGSYWVEARKTDDEAVQRWQSSSTQAL